MLIVKNSKGQSLILIGLKTPIQTTPLSPLGVIHTYDSSTLIINLSRTTK